MVLLSPYNLILVKNNKYISSPQRGASKISDSEKFGLKKSEFNLSSQLQLTL